MGIRHKHSEVIKSWADGVEIEGRYPGELGFNEWRKVTDPSWFPDWEYRVLDSNQEFIDAEKSGKQIQWFDPILNAWVDKTIGLRFRDNVEYRIKPKPVKVEFEDPTSSIEDIIDCFDFERVKKVMDFLDWQWYDCGVPEIWDLRKKARVLLNDVWNAVRKEAEKSPDKEERYSIANGGFYVEAIKYSESPKVYLSLKFQIADWDNWC